jgi:hypothetical protein
MELREMRVLVEIKRRNQAIRRETRHMLRVLKVNTEKQVQQLLLAWVSKGCSHCHPE